MKTTLTRMKTLAQNNIGSSGTLSYVNHVEICHPEIALIEISRTRLPSIFFAPIRTSEDWNASQQKIQVNEVTAYLMMEYNQRELSIIGDSTRPQGKGMLDFVADFFTVFRDHRLSVDGTIYLSKPLEIANVDYSVEGISDDAFMIVASIPMTATRLFIQDTLPGNI